jgi:hypothetical protein
MKIHLNIVGARTTASGTYSAGGIHGFRNTLSPEVKGGLHTYVAER